MALLNCIFCSDAPRSPYLAAMERAGFPVDDVDYVRRIFALFAPAA